MSIFEKKRGLASSESDSPSESPLPEPATITPEQVEQLLNELRVGRRPTDNIEEVASDVSLSLLIIIKTFPH